MEYIDVKNKFDIIDLDYIKKILKMLLFYERKDLAFYKFLKKIENYWDIAIVETDEIITIYKSAIIFVNKERLQGDKLLEQIRNEVIIKFPVLEKEIKLWELENQQNDLRNEYELIIKDLTNRFKLFSIFKFVAKVKNIISNYLTNIDDLTDTEEEFTHSINYVIKEFQEDLHIETQNTETLLNDIEVIEELIQENITKLAESEKIKSIIPSSISTLNLVFSNLEGYEKSTLNIIGSYIGSGKTRYLINEGVYAFEKGFNVLHISIENKIEEINNIYLSRLLGIPINKLYSLYKNYYRDEEAKKKVREIIQTLKELINSKPNKLKIKKFPVKGTLVEEIDIYIDKLTSSEFIPDIVIIDHMDIVYPSLYKGKSVSDDNMYNFGKQVSIELKEIAEKYNVVLLTATQVNREGQKDLQSIVSLDISTDSNNESENSNKRKKKNPYETFLHRGKIAKSLAKVEYADTFITINKTIDENMQQVARLYIDKNRYGVSYLLIPIEFDLSTSKAQAILDLNRLQQIYGNTPLIYKSLAYLYYLAVKSENPKLVKMYIDKLEEFLPYLINNLKPHAVKLIHKYKSTNNSNESVIKIENIEKVNDILYPSQFINKLIEYYEKYEPINIEVDDDKDILKVEFMNNKTGEIFELKTSKSDLIIFKNQIEDEELITIINELLEE